MLAAAATVLVVTAALVAMPSPGFSAGGARPDPAASQLEFEIRGLGPAQKKARARALAKCREIQDAKKRKACVSKVKKRFARISGRPDPLPTGPVVQIEVRDKYFSPDEVELPRYGSVRWVWSSENSEPHDVTLLSGPRGVLPNEFQTPLAPSVDYELKRTFEVPGTYRLACSLHHLMTMKVEVGR